MRHLRIVRGYAKALLLAAEDANVLDEIEAGIQELRALLDASEPFRQLIEDTMVPPRTKEALFSEIFDDVLPPLLRSFLSLLLEKRRERELDAILEETLHQIDERRGIETAHLTTAVPLADAQVDRMAEALSRLTEKQIRVHETVDPSILGGFVVRVQDTVYDASLTAQLARLRDALVQGE